MFTCVLFYSEGIDKTWSLLDFKDFKSLNNRFKMHEKPDNI